jgi:hypothetical protein
MAKGGGTTSGGNGGIMGSGIFGLFGTTIQCPASDTSYYCTFMKFFNIIMIVGFLLIIMYYGYTLFIQPSFKKGRR